MLQWQAKGYVLKKCLLFLVRKSTLLIHHQSTAMRHLFPLPNTSGTEHQLWTSKTVEVCEFKIHLRLWPFIRGVTRALLFAVIFQKIWQLGVNILSKNYHFPASTILLCRSSLTCCTNVISSTGSSRPLNVTEQSII